MPRGGWRGGGRPLKDEGVTRENVGCRVKSVNKVWLESEKERTGRSIGEIVDRAVEVLQEHPEKQYPGTSEEPDA